MGAEWGPAERADEERLAGRERQPAPHPCTISFPYCVPPQLPMWSCQPGMPACESCAAEGHMEALPAALTADGTGGPWAHYESLERLLNAPVLPTAAHISSSAQHPRLRGPTEPTPDAPARLRGSPLGNRQLFSFRLH